MEINKIIKLLSDAIARLRTKRFTGKFIFEINFNQGGLTHVIKKTEEVVKG